MTPLNNQKAPTAEQIKALLQEKGDFAFEMEVGALIRNTAIPVNGHLSWEHGATYADPLTNKDRQFDYRCVLDKLGRNVSTQLAYLSIECKNIKPDVPLIVSGIDRSSSEDYYDVIKGWMNLGLYYSAVHRESITRFYKVGAFVGKSMNRIKTVESGKGEQKQASFDLGNDHDVFERLGQAVASCVELADRALAACRELNVSRTWALVLPVVVLPNDSLWTVSYNGFEPSTPTRTESCTMFTGKAMKIGRPDFSSSDVKDFSLSHVHIVTLAGLQELLSQLFGDGFNWCG